MQRPLGKRCGRHSRRGPAAPQVPARLRGAAEKRRAPPTRAGARLGGRLPSKHRAHCAAERDQQRRRRAGGERRNQNG